MYIPIWAIVIFLVGMDIYQGAKQSKLDGGMNGSLLFWGIIGFVTVLIAIPIGLVWWIYKTVPGASFPVGPSIFLAIIIGFFWWLSKRASS
jgi:hypothetical protein